MKPLCRSRIPKRYWVEAVVRANSYFFITKWEIARKCKQVKAREPQSWLQLVWNYFLAQPVVEKCFVLQEIQIFSFKLVTESSAREHRKFINFQFPWNCFFLSRTNSKLSNPSQGEVSFYIARDVRESWSMQTIKLRSNDRVHSRLSVA